MTIEAVLVRVGKAVVILPWLVSIGRNLELDEGDIEFVAGEHILIDVIADLCWEVQEDGHCGSELDFWGTGVIWKNIGLEGVLSSFVTY